MQNLFHVHVGTECKILWSWAESNLHLKYTHMRDNSFLNISKWSCLFLHIDKYDNPSSGSHNILNYYLH